MRTLQILHLASLSGMLLLWGIFYFVLEPDYGWSFDLADIQLTFTLIAVTGAHFLGRYLYNRRREQAKALDADKRAALYRGTVIIRLALLEVVILITLILFLVKSNTALLLPFALGLLFFVQTRPGREQFLRDWMS